MIERTLFVYNIVLSNHFNITKKYKKKCIHLLVEIQTYFGNIRNQNYDTKDVNYQFRQYKILMNSLDYLLKSFDNIDGSEEIKQIWTNKFVSYVSETINHTWINPYYDKNYITDFVEFFMHIPIKSLLTRDSNDLIYCNKFYLL
jgi:hypothetical protein